MGAPSPRELPEHFVRSFNARDLAGIVALYDAQAVLTRRDHEVRGLSDIEIAFRESLARARTTLTLEHVHELTSGDVCFCLCTYDVDDRAQDGAPRRYKWKSIEISRRQSDGSWKYLIDDPFILNTG